MRSPILVANWKMHKITADVSDFVKKFLENFRQQQRIEVVIAPPFTAIVQLQNLIKATGIKLAAQNCHYMPEGPFTGEVSPAMLKDAGCEYVIIGHSERRQQFAENDELVQKKLKAVLDTDLKPILCVGESLMERQAGLTEAILTSQLESAFENIAAEQMMQVVIAYEPVWAIGTGQTASPANAQTGAAFIRRVTEKQFDRKTAQAVRIQYGGSVKPENTEQIFEQPDIDGALVGGASLDPTAFLKIIAAGARSKS